MPLCLIGLGSNLGDRSSLLEQAIVALERTAEAGVLRRSGFYETPPVGGPGGQGAFLNAAVLVETHLSPERLLDAVERIETNLGRRREVRWGPRRIDIDLLLFDGAIVASERLQLPHPRMAWRRFVLAPAAEIAPAMRHPTIGWTVAQMLEHLAASKPYVAIAGPPGAGKARVAEEAADRMEGMWIADPAGASANGQVRLADPYGVAWEAAIEFVERRAEVLAVDSPLWNEDKPLWVSDFWVGQTAAIICRMAKEADRELLLERWRGAVRDARPPVLTVLLNAPTDWCMERLAERGSSDTGPEAFQGIEAIGRALREYAAETDCGPVLELDGQRPGEAVEELVAAVLSMK